MNTNDKVHIAQEPALNKGAVSGCYLSAEKAKQITIEAQKEILARKHDVECVLSQIEEAARNGSFELQTYNDDEMRNNLIVLGFSCSPPFKTWLDEYMTVTWL